VHTVQQSDPHSILHTQFDHTAQPACGVKLIAVSNESAYCLTFNFIVCLMSSI